MNVDHQQSLEAEVARLRQDVKIEAHARQRNHERAEAAERVADYQLQAANKALRKADAAERELALCRRDREEAERLYDRCEIRYMAAERELARLQEGLRRIQQDARDDGNAWIVKFIDALLAEDDAT